MGAADQMNYRCDKNFKYDYTLFFLLKMIEFHQNEAQSTEGAMDKGI